MEIICSLVESLVQRKTCPVSDEGAGPCTEKADTAITIGSNFGLETYLVVCSWHAYVIEGV